MKVIAALLVLLISASAQEPSSLEKAIKELQTEIESTRLEVKALRIQQEKLAARRERRGEQPAAGVATKQQPPARKKHVDVDALITEREETLRAVELTLAELSQVNTPAERRQAIAAMVVERAILQGKIRRANKRWGCRLLHLGCIGKR